MSKLTHTTKATPNFACFLTVRTGSTRLPQKTLLEMRGKRLIEHVIERMKLLREVSQVILCTSTEPSDDILETIAQENGINVFRGSLHDKLARWLGAVNQFDVDYFVTVDAADDIFCDPELIDLAVKQMKTKPCDYLKIPNDLVCGGAAPVISRAALTRVCEIKDTNNVENYAPYFLDTGLFKVREIKVKDKIFHNKKVRLTLDYKEDYDFFSRIFNEFKMDSNTVPLRQIVALLNKKPELNKINFHRHQDYLNNQKRITSLVLKKNYKNIRPDEQKNSEGWRFKGNELKYLSEVLSSDLKVKTLRGWVSRFEKAFAERFGIKYAVASNSGTATLHQALAAFGVGPGDEVIVPAMTVIMCGYAVVHMHAKPVYADVDPRTFLIDPKDIERKITPKTKAIMVVHFCGQVCDMDSIMKIAKKYKLWVLEDCAQCYLGRGTGGRLAGTIGHIGSFSLESTKMITSGEGGVLITNNEKLSERMRKFGAMGFKMLSATGAREMPNALMFQDPKYLRHDAFGYNYRMSEILATIALAQLERIDFFFKKRLQMAKKYQEVLKNCTWLSPQYTPPGEVNAYWTFAFLFEGQKKLRISWYDFRDKFLEFGGDKIRSTFALVYNEPTMINLNKKGKYFQDIKKKQGLFHKNYLKKSNCPVAERIQPKVMQLTTNQNTVEEMGNQARSLRKTIDYFEQINKLKKDK